MNHYELSAVVLPINSSKEIKEIQKMINKEDLVDWNFAPGGIPEQYHITLLNGIAGQLSDCQEALWDYLDESYDLTNLEFGYFESENWVAPHIKIKGTDADKISLLNEKLRARVPHIDSYPKSNPNEFKAHITLCYIKKTEFAKYRQMLENAISEINSLIALPPIFLQNIGYGKSQEVSLVDRDYLNKKLEEIVEKNKDGTSLEFKELNRLAKANGYSFDLYYESFYKDKK